LADTLQGLGQPGDWQGSVRSGAYLWPGNRAGRFPGRIRARWLAEPVHARRLPREA